MSTAAEMVPTLGIWDPRRRSCQTVAGFPPLVLRCSSGRCRQWTKPATKRKFSAATLGNMREAQKKRWAKMKGTLAPAPEAETKAKPKRKMSAAGRKAIAAAQKKRWAAKKT